MKTIIIGGVAAGTKAAAKLKRETPQDEIVIYTKGKDISYAGCGLPYYIGGAIGTEEELIVNTPAKFMGLTGAEVHTGCEVTAVDPAGKTVTIGKDGEETVSYDRLVIAVGAEPSVPPVDGTGLPGVFTVRTPEDAIGPFQLCGCLRSRRNAAYYYCFHSANLLFIFSFLISDILNYSIKIWLNQFFYFNLCQRFPVH
mgnify:CR=1 FL=1